METKKVRAIKQYHLRAGVAERSGGEKTTLIELQLTAWRPIPRFKDDLCRTEWLALTPDLAISLIQDLQAMVTRLGLSEKPPGHSH